MVRVVWGRKGAEVSVNSHKTLKQTSLIGIVSLGLFTSLNNDHILEREGEVSRIHQLCLQCFCYQSLQRQQPRSNFSMPSSINQDLLLLQKERYVDFPA